MPWNCPHCHQETGRPVFIHAGEGRMTIHAKCETCGREWTVVRQELDMRHLGRPVLKPDARD
jgi:hypothetical protein